MLDRSNLDWRYRDEYIQTRSMRSAGDTDIAPGWANEAAADPMAQIVDPDLASTSGRSVRIIGYSPSADLVITVIAVSDEGVTYRVNAWRANTRDEREYWEAP